MGQTTLLSGTLANLGSVAQKSAIQGDAMSMPYALILVLDVTQLTGTSVQVQLQMLDPASGKFVNWGAAFAAVVATGTATYVVGPTGIGAAAGGVTATLNLPVPPQWQVVLTPVAVTSISYTLSAMTVALNN